MVFYWKILLKMDDDWGYPPFKFMESSKWRPGKQPWKHALRFFLESLAASKVASLPLLGEAVRSSRLRSFAPTRLDNHKKATMSELHSILAGSKTTCFTTNRKYLSHSKGSFCRIPQNSFVKVFFLYLLEALLAQALMKMVTQCLISQLNDIFPLKNK